MATWKGTMELIGGRGQGPASPTRSPRTPISSRRGRRRARRRSSSTPTSPGFIRRVQEDLGPDEQKFVKALGLDGFTFAAGGLSIGDKAVLERFFLGTVGDKKGLAKFLSLKGAAAGFESAPQDALQFVSFSIELGELYDTVLEVLKGVDDFKQQQVLDDIAAFEKEVGFSIKNDLFPAFGPRMWWYSALPPDG
jgi:hypothetical protein